MHSDSKFLLQDDTVCVDKAYAGIVIKTLDPFDAGLGSGSKPKPFFPFFSPENYGLGFRLWVLCSH